MGQAQNGFRNLNPQINRGLISGNFRLTLSLHPEQLPAIKAITAILSMPVIPAILSILSIPVIQIPRANLCTEAIVK